MDKTRIPDIEYLLKVLRNPFTSSGEKREAQESLKKIRNESSLVKSMRQRLIYETRQGNYKNVRDINEYVFGKDRYQ